ncbi:hypothetical protein BJY00DRAFT_68238 [Aspergillus carlsbadensis]|nr:hypothetical protein BJY00DRAFT_68238 [Aspergillus carlsbadensis]
MLKSSVGSYSRLYPPGIPFEADHNRTLHQGLLSLPVKVPQDSSSYRGTPGPSVCLSDPLGSRSTSTAYRTRGLRPPDTLLRPTTPGKPLLHYGVTRNARDVIQDMSLFKVMHPLAGHRPKLFVESRHPLELWINPVLSQFASGNPARALHKYPLLKLHHS